VERPVTIHTRRVLLAGTFEPDVSRNRIIREVLDGLDIAVEDARVALWGTDRFRLVDQSKSKLVFRMLRAYASLLPKLMKARRPDVALVLYPGYFDMLLIKAMARLRKFVVVFDIFISLEDTMIGDRALRSSRSWLSRIARRVDRSACRRADLVLADTLQHADHFSASTAVCRDRFRVLWVGAQNVFRPQPEVTPTPRLVLFYGTYIPLQGIETIVRAAKLVEDDGIRFRLVGDGQERPRIERLANELEVRNIEVVGLLPLERLPREIASASLCLGIFGTTPKAGRVIPNKVYECVAMGRPVLTADTPAIRDTFDGAVATVPPGDHEALAAAIRGLCADPAALEDLGRRGHERYQRDFSHAALGETLVSYLDELLAGR
jgi:glycosyltransferase involved in cell wall biosynthesis